MKRFLVAAICILSITGSFAQDKTAAWSLFARTKFTPKYDESLGEYLMIPTFSADLKALEGKEITIEGYYVPFAPENGDYIILSKYPMSQCYFCGGGGPETIAEVFFAKPPGNFRVDDLVTVKGKLELNADDLDHVNFIIRQATKVN